jgi:hypothetical protein
MPTDTLSFDDSDKRWLAYSRAHVGNLELLPAIVTHWERTAKPKGLDKATLSEDRYISRRLQKHLGGLDIRGALTEHNHRRSMRDGPIPHPAGCFVRFV